jgi:hypothetical protein
MKAANKKLLDVKKEVKEKGVWKMYQFLQLIIFLHRFVSPHSLNS